MTVTTVLAVVPASDLAASRAWWTRVWGREPDHVPMPSDVEWHVPGGGGMQLVDDPAHAGAGSITLGVDDVDAEVVAIQGRGIDAPQAETVPSGQFRVVTLTDPDGNAVVLGQPLDGRPTTST